MDPSLGLPVGVPHPLDWSKTQDFSVFQHGQGRDLVARPEPAFRRTKLGGRWLPEFIGQECIQTWIGVGVNAVYYLHPSAQHPPVPDGKSLRLQREAALARVWQRLSPRLARSADLACHHVTARAADMRCEPGPDGVAVRVAYDINGAAAQPGEPTRTRLVDLPAGVGTELPVDAAADSAWLVIDGNAQIGTARCPMPFACVSRCSRPSGRSGSTAKCWAICKDWAPGCWILPRAVAST